MTRILAGLVVAVAIATFGAPARAASISTDLSDPLVILAPGEAITIQIIADTDPLFTVEVWLTFDPALVGTSAVVNGGEITGGLCAGVVCAPLATSGTGFQLIGIHDGSGLVGGIPQPINGGATPFVLGELTVTALGTGTTDVVMDPAFDHWDNAGQTLFTVQVSEAPEPSSLVLLGFGLVGLAGLRCSHAARGLSGQHLVLPG